MIFKAVSLSLSLRVINVKALVVVGFQLGEDPNWTILRDCEIFANLHFEALFPQSAHGGLQAETCVKYVARGDCEQAAARWR